MKVYLNSYAQISVQKPLEPDWFENPIAYEENYVRAQNPDFKPFVNPIAARRMGNILKRAMATSLTALKEASLSIPEAIVTATGFGCIENTEKFLDALHSEAGETLLQPTFFINSTHNTIGSYIGVQLKCHGYNNTYAHGGISFESALYDAFLHLKNGDFKNVLVGAHDELTPKFNELLQKINQWEGGFASETATSFVLTTNPTNIEIVGVDILFQPTKTRLITAVNDLCKKAQISITDINLIVTGENKSEKNNAPYEMLKNVLRIPTESFKPIFGEGFTASSFGLVYAIESLRRKISPQKQKVNTILIFNHYQNTEYAITLLKKC